MTRLWLVRHGQTAWNLEGRYQGQADPPLTAAGWEQARAMLPQLDGIAFAAIYSSDLRRARDTASILAAHLGLPVQVRVGLREVRLGLWEGMLFSDIQDQYAAAWQERQRDPLHARPPQGETLAEVAVRASAAADEIAQAHPAADVLVVAHGLTLATLLCLGRGLPLERAYDLVPDNCRPEVVDWPPHAVGLGGLRG
ncbi:MAG: histidine phosphatase family protein [Anaerolineales bacterium]|nr:histidine phosphatase family protein [Anaerolineales bacterium]